jgi:hypothetical protein
MAINFDSFTTGTPSNIQSDDYVVGFGDTNPNGERKWTVSTIANAVSGLIRTEMANFMNNTLTLGNYPYLEVGWVTAPNTAAYTVLLNSTWQTLNLKTVISQNGASFGILNSTLNEVTLNSGTYRFQVELVGWIDPAQGNYSHVMALYATDGTYICSTGRNGDASFSTFYPWTGQFTINSSKTIELVLNTDGTGAGAQFFIGNYDTGGNHNSTTANSSTRISLKLWKVG